MPKIALIDDDPEEHLLIARQLRQVEGLCFHAFENCAQAVAALLAAPADLLLIDANRAGNKTPRQTAQDLQRQGLTCPMVLVSNALMRPDAATVKDYAGYIQKDQISGPAVSAYL